ncbi:MAG: serpin family protein [Myxococcota bacterium]
MPDSSFSLDETAIRRTALALFTDPQMDVRANLALSPVSLWLMLVVLQAAARGETARALAELTGVTGAVGPIIDAPFAALGSAGPADAAKRVTASALHAGILLAIDEGYPLHESFMREVRGPLTEVMRLPFADAEPSAAAINAWISRSTHGLIAEPVLPSALAAPVRMLPTTAVGFDARWRDPMNPAGRRRFDGFDRRLEVPMSTLTKRLPYAQNDDVQAVALPYADTPFEAIVLRPRRSGPEAFARARATPTDDLLAQLEEHRVEVHLPSFALECDVTLGESLARLAPAPIFGLDTDYGGASAEPGLTVEALRQLVRIEVDALGTKAAAVTTAKVFGHIPVKHKEPETIRLHFDRPFLLFIWDPQSQVVLFMAQIVEPQAS